MANLSRIRRVIRQRSTVTRAELARETKISSTTVRALLAEMLHDGELESAGFDGSSGGRKAERYRFKRDKYYGAAFCVAGEETHYILVDICGEIVEKGRLRTLTEDVAEPITAFLDELLKRREIKSIGLGVPGIVAGDGYYKKNRDNELHRVELAKTLTKRYGVPVVMENDLNAITIGFGQCYEKQFPGDAAENANMAFLYFEQDCVSAGFLVGGRVVRGQSGYAGELGLIPLKEGKTLSEHLSALPSDKHYISAVAEAVCWVCGILNPQYVALGGPAFRKNCLAAIGDWVYSALPCEMLPELLYSDDVWHDYYEGMAYLTAGKMFDEIRLTSD